MANTHLSRTNGTPTTQNLWTWSAWVKFSNDNQAGATDGTLLSEYQSASAWHKYERISNNRLRYNAGASGHGSFVTSRNFSDLNAWYHIVIINDWQNSTTADRIRLYVNGVRETAFDSFNHPTSGGSRINEAGKNIRIGSYNNGLYFNGSMSHIHFTDGTAYDPSYFGSTDTTTGEWQINTSPSVTYGNNGYFILKDGNSVTDQSGNSNNWTIAGGTLRKTEDCPDNVFATFNGAFNLSDIVLLRGNASATSSGASWKYVPTTLGASSGKFYAEYLCGGSANAFMHGVVDMEYAVSQDQNSYTQLGNGTGGMGYYSGGESYTTGTATSYGDSYAVGDYIGIALDMDNNKVYFSKNGVWQNSGDPTSGATGTGALSLPTTGTYAFGTSVKDSSKTDANFGNGYFGTTAVSSAGTNASGIGIFEYDVPTGYTALSTKGLNL